ncbi:MAG: hypothetical protein QNJ55_14260 [Xenococcus sp. MO_188.B8]|nr:hypothetical protein [Xenococcus sp. MO_188.B8]
MTENKAKTNKQSKTKEKMLFVLEVFIIDGPMTEKFIEQNPVVSRTIEIRSDQTLANLHAAIFKAFEREEEHMYEFQIGGKGPHDPQAKRYGLSTPLQDQLEEDQYTGNVAQTKIGSLNLKIDQNFGYWFDFGDDWWHQIDVMDIKKATPRKRYPKVTDKMGVSPPQYIDWDEEE